MVRAAVLPHNYPQLQALIRRDAASYRDEFEQQWRQALSLLGALDAAAGPDALGVLSLVAHTAPLYKGRGAEFAAAIGGVLERDAHTLSSEVRLALLRALLVLRKADALPSVSLVDVLLRLLSVRDKALREAAVSGTISEVVRANAKTKSHALNAAIQGRIAEMLKSLGPAEDEEASGLALRLIKLLAELFRRGPWADARTANAVADAAVALRSPRPLLATLHFFLGRFDPISDADPEKESTPGDENEKYRALLVRSQISGRTRAAGRKLKRQLSAVRRAEERADGEATGRASVGGSAPLLLLHDPQAFAERLFASLKRTKESFEVKLALMDVISRAVGAHGLLLPELYSFLLRFLTPHQRDVSKILAVAAQACHPLAPPEAVAELVRAIGRSFAAEYCAPAVIAAGLNGICALVRRCPAAIPEEGDTLLALVATFRGASDKGVLTAVRGLLALLRELAPGILHRRDRGRDVSVAMAAGALRVRPLHYGAVPVLDARLPSHSGDSPIDQSEAVAESESDAESECDSALESDSEQGVDGSSDKESECHSECESVDQSESAPRAKRQRLDIVQAAMARPLSSRELVLLRRRAAGLDAPPSDASSDSGSDGEDESPPDGAVDPRSLESARRGKSDYDARMASIMAGREGRAAFGSRRGKHHGGASLTNALKAKRTKNPIMLAHKGAVRAKQRRSGRDVQLARRKHAINQRRRG